MEKHEISTDFRFSASVSAAARLCASDFKWKQFPKQCAWAFHSFFLGSEAEAGLMLLCVSFTRVSGAFHSKKTKVEGFSGMFL